MACRKLSGGHAALRRGPSCGTPSTFVLVVPHSFWQVFGKLIDGLDTLDKLERELRKVHDKKIFKNRREARQSDNKRNTG